MPKVERKHGGSGCTIWSAAILVAAGLADRSQAQVFAQPFHTYDIVTQQTAQTIDTDLGSPFCTTPWNQHWSGTQPLSISHVLNEWNGGCPLVTLAREVTVSVSVGGGSAVSMTLLCRIRANMSNQIGQMGHATGQMGATIVGGFVLNDWVVADVTWSAAADRTLQQAQAWIEVELVGPVDPQTDQGAMIHDSWAGSGRVSLHVGQVLLAPGKYEFRMLGTGSFMPVGGFTTSAQVDATLSVQNPALVQPPEYLDLNGDGVVNLDDACLWVESPTDANQDGVIDSRDLDHIMALARSIGDTVTDNNGDGVPDQCSCPADWNADGTLDFFDIQGYLTAFSMGSPAADLTGDGMLDFFDVLAFLALFSGGC